jgi:hypothetical protein
MGAVSLAMAGAYFDPTARIGIVYLRNSRDPVPDEAGVFHALSLLADVHRGIEQHAAFDAVKI